ncbi:MAG: translation initiation factor IF-3 [Nitrospinota bacterium]|nr:translation initiation factor IF-3 [Nitrospinota bacterium]
MRCGISNVQKRLKVNDQISSKSVMVVGSDGEQLGVLSLTDALEHASDVNMDLVEVAPNAKPPVCRIMDYGKLLYRQSKKAHDAKKRQKIIRLKEVKITPKTEEHDYQFKLSHVKRFLAEGDKVKVSVFFKGRLITHTELGIKVLDRFKKDLSQVAVVESEPERMGKTLSIVVAPVAPPKVTKQQDEKPEENDIIADTEPTDGNVS